MTRMLDRLEQKELIVRNRCPEDRRQVRLALTAEGQRLADRLPEIGAAAMNELVGVLEPEELKALEGLLAKVLISAGDPLTISRFADR